MKRFLMIGGLAAGGALIFLMADKLSRDAVGMALGMFFGVCAGIPAALLVMAANRAAAPRPVERAPHSPAYPAAPQMPVILVTGQGFPRLNAQNTPPYWNLSDLQAQPVGQSFSGARQFRVVGEKDEMVDEW